MELADAELGLLEEIYKREREGSHPTQRELAATARLSLGTTNAFLRRFAERGWVRLTRLSTKQIRYEMTPEGIAQVAQGAAGHFKRASRNSDLYRDRIEAFIILAKARGAVTLVLAGPSELDFFFEQACDRNGISFVKSSDISRALSLGRHQGVVLICAEERRDSLPEAAASISEIIAGTAGLPEGAQ
jgi:hypothetical protein